MSDTASHPRRRAVVTAWVVEPLVACSSSTPTTERIAENFDIFDFKLTSDEIAAIDALGVGERGGPDPEQPQPGFHSFDIPEA